MYYTDIKKLQRAGYEVIEQSPWHYQVEQNGVVCNIWPSKRKYMVEYGGGASFYDDVVEAVESIVGPAGVKETRAQRIARLKAQWAIDIPVPAFPEAEKVWRYELDLVVKMVQRAIKRKDDMDF